MDQETKDEFVTTYKKLLDSLNEQKKAGEKYDFPAELKAYETANGLDPIGYFQARARGEGWLRAGCATTSPRSCTAAQSRLRSACCEGSP